MLPVDRILGKFIRRAFWMNDPMSTEFRMFFMEMITEIRNLSGRSFNADITLSDLKRTITSITEKYPPLKRISLNTVFKTMNTMDSLSKAGDLFSIASAVSASWLSIGTLFIGPLPYMLLKVFAPGRLKCGVIMGVGGMIGLELYDLKQVTLRAGNMMNSWPLPEKKRISPSALVSGISAIAIFLVSVFTPAGMIFLKITELLASILLFAVFLTNIGLGLLRSGKAAIHEMPTGKDPFKFRTEDDNSLISNFRLDGEEARFLFSLYYTLADESIENTPDHKIKADKRIWIDKWKSGVEEEIGGGLVTDPDIMKNVISGPMQGLSKVKTSLILMECSLFKPFFSLNELSDINIPSRDGVIPLKIIDELAKDFYGLYVKPAAFRTAYQEALRGLNSLNIIKQALQSFALPSIAPFTVIQNDTGLIKKPPVIGRDGMAGPVSHFIGGGVMLERDMHPLLCTIALTSSSSILYQSARLESAYRTILRENSSWNSLMEFITGVETELRGLLVRKFNEENGDREELKNSIHFLEVSIKRAKDARKQNNK
ncbi:MAG: hypothetical protein ABSG94_06835 [Brevinematales bacterium]|jgi:hypothetical protein